MVPTIAGMGRMVAVGFALALVAAACTPSASEPSTTESAVTTTEAPEEQGADDRLVVLTLQGVVEIHGSDGALLTTIEPPPSSFYRSPTWLDGSTVVFSETAQDGGHALVAVDTETGEVVWRAPMETPPFYFSPAPEGSTFATTSLRNNPLAPGLIAEAVDKMGAVTRLSTESPFYTAWSPDGQQLAVHIAGVRLDIVEGPNVETVLSGTGFFQAPVWTEAGLLTLRTEAGTQVLSVWNDGSFRDVATIEGAAGFVASGNLVAIQLTDEDNSGAVQASVSAQAAAAIPLGELVVLDLATGTIDLVTREFALGYQWNQTGESLVYATVGAQSQTLVWHIWTDGETSGLEPFALQPPWVSNFLPFFDQYAQSLNIWSAAGNRIAYPAVVDSLPVVVIESVDGSERVLIDDATWAAWAPRI